MNILAFMKPKVNVTYMCEDNTVREAIEIMRKCRYTSIPLLSKTGKYVGTITEGDLLYTLDRVGRDEVKKIIVSSIKRHRDYEAVNINETMLVLLSRASNENFVPIVDDSNQFLGIVKRKELLDYFFEHNFMVL
ncbi:MAG: CBS domain-containing protein [Candidatus Izemoplasmatales bacterium]|nr:CBS domain-containing protein [Candidatus Izemoplasmatales bacterium]